MTSPRTLALLALVVLLAPNARGAAPVMSFFVTSTGRGDGANLGGLEGADGHCQRLAAAVGAGDRTWRAYLSSMATATQAAVHARDRIGPGPWFNARGALIAKDGGRLHGPYVNLDLHTALTERGEPVRGTDWSRDGAMPEHDMLTGSLEDGRAPAGPEDATCANWTSAAEGHALVGHHDRQGGGTHPTSWSSAHLSRGCSAEKLRASGSAGRFYCFAADRDDARPRDPSALPWIEDDFEVAKAEAASRRVPLVIDVWVPWNEGSRFMQGDAYVDPAVRALAGRFVWARLSLDKPQSAPAVAALGALVAEGTLVVADPSGVVVARREGLASGAELRQLLIDAERSASGRVARGADRLLLDADRAVVARRYADAAKGFRAALEQAPPQWPSAARASLALLDSLRRTEELQACAGEALERAPRLGDPFKAQAALLGLSCAARAPGAEAWRPRAVERLRPLVVAAAQSPLLLFDAAAAQELLLELEPAEPARRVDAWFDAAARLAAGAPNAMVRTAAAHLLTAAPLRSRHCGEARELLLRFEAEEPLEYTYPHVLAHCLDAADRQAAMDARLRAYSKQGYGSSKVLGLYFLAQQRAKQGALNPAVMMLRTAIAMAEVPGVLPVPFYDVTLEQLGAALKQADDALQRAMSTPAR